MSYPTILSNPDIELGVKYFYLGFYDLFSRYHKNGKLAFAAEDLSRVLGISKARIYRGRAKLRDYGMLEWEQLRDPSTNYLVHDIYKLKPHVHPTNIGNYFFPEIYHSQK